MSCGFDAETTPLVHQLHFDHPGNLLRIHARRREVPRNDFLGASTSSSVAEVTLNGFDGSASAMAPVSGSGLDIKYTKLRFFDSRNSLGNRERRQFFLTIPKTM
jgi:hypothetical protein